MRIIIPLMAIGAALISTCCVAQTNASTAQRIGQRLNNRSATALGNNLAAANTVRSLTAPTVADAFDPDARDLKRAAADECFGQTLECQRVIQDAQERSGDPN